MARVQKVDDSLGSKLEADLHAKSHTQGHEQQVLPPAVLLVLPPVLHRLSVLSGEVDFPQSQEHLHHGEEHDDEAFAQPLLGGDEGGTVGASVALELGVHSAVDPVQQAVDVIPRHVPLLVLEKVRTRRNEGQHTDFLSKHELQRFARTHNTHRAVKKR